jgi:hypothetical protein
MVRKNIRISNLTEKINGCFPGWEIEELKKINDEINNDKIEGIDEEVMKQMKELLD